MQNPPPDEEGLADDIVGAVAYEAPSRKKKDFLPWHRPRKQFVRHHQWCEQIEALLPGIQAGDGILKYLGLPGVDLLDLRYFHDHVCQPNNIRLKFLGFNSGANPLSTSQTELNISLHEVRKLAFVHPISEVIGDNFCLIANESSMAWDTTKQFGPYDVINLDLCDGFGVHEPGVLEDTHYNAVSRLLSLQARNKNPWLLLITTRTGQEHVHHDVLQIFIQKFIDNLRDCQSFQVASEKNFAIADEAALRAAVNSSRGISTVFLTGLCKWLLGLAIGHASKIEVKSVIGYRIVPEAEHEDLVSIALKFEPTFVPVQDALGLAIHQPNPPNECVLATKALNRVAKCVDADALLAQDSDLNHAMEEATAGLLEKARYDVQEFHAWLNNPPTSV
jgi:hypothetical protein